jgi:hypothetical protein
VGGDEPAVRERVEQLPKREVRVRELTEDDNVDRVQLLEVGGSRRPHVHVVPNICVVSAHFLSSPGEVVQDSSGTVDTNLSVVGMSDHGVADSQMFL